MPHRRDALRAKPSNDKAVTRMVELSRFGPLVVVALLVSPFLAACKERDAASLKDESDIPAPAAWTSPWDKLGVAGKYRNHPLTKLQDQGTQSPPLSPPELEALFYYQGDGYQLVNGHLRGKELPPQHRAKAVRAAAAVQGVIQRQ